MYKCVIVYVYTYLYQGDPTWANRIFIKLGICTCIYMRIYMCINTCRYIYTHIYF